MLINTDGVKVLSIPLDFSLSPEILRGTLAKGEGRTGMVTYRVAPLILEGKPWGHFLIALSEEQVYAEAHAALVLTAEVGTAFMLPVSLLIAWLLA